MRLDLCYVAELEEQRLGRAHGGKSTPISLPSRFTRRVPRVGGSTAHGAMRELRVLLDARSGGAASQERLDLLAEGLSD